MHRVRIFLLVIGLVLVPVVMAHAGVATNAVHPRLYFNATELEQLRHERGSGLRGKIYHNLMESADWCLTKSPRKNWIAPITPDPVYENLYDRFFAIMGDLAITEHLSFAYALSGKEKYGEAARQWVLASCRVWQREAEGTPDSGKGYAVSRLLKGISVGYDIVYDRFTEAERKEIRDTLTRIGRRYFTQYFSTPSIAGPGFHTHHAIVEWGSFGVASLALLGEEPDAQRWLDATVKKFEDHLLPTGIAPDGAQTEGGTFWASTMHYRLFFMDPLRRVTGRDLFTRFASEMKADLALAEIATEKFPGHEQSYANVVFQPYYGQLDYYAPLLLCLAREYRRPVYQYLALWDHSLGCIQQTRAITPHGEQLIFELGGYAYLWCDPSIRAKADSKKLSYQFPSVDEAYLRTSWRAGDLLVGVSKGQLLVHAGGLPILIEPGLTDAPTNSVAATVDDQKDVATIRCGNSPTNSLEVQLDRKKHTVKITRNSPTAWKFWAHGTPVRKGNELTWKKQSNLRVEQGTVSGFDATGFFISLKTGFNKLALNDPAPMKFPLVTVTPSENGQIVLEIRLLK